MRKMKNLYFILLSCLFFVGFFLISSQKVYAATVEGAPFDVYIDENNNVCIYTIDKLKDSSIYYVTQGFSISKCAYDPTKRELSGDNEYRIMWLDEMQVETKNIGGVQENLFMLTVDQLISLTGGKWGEQIKKAIDGTGPAVYVKFDCIMNVFYGEAWKSGPYTNFPHECTNEKAGLKNPAEIIAAEPWANPKGLKWHYNRYLLIGGADKTKPQQITGEADKYIMTDFNEQEYWTGNWSDLFDIGKAACVGTGDGGIPSSEDLNNRVKAVEWYGTTDVYIRVATNDYPTVVTYNYEIEKEDEDDDKEEGGGEGGEDKDDEDSGTTTESGSIDVTYGTLNDYGGKLGEMTANVAFSYLANMAIYDYANISVSNLAFPASVFYDSKVDVPVEAITTKEYRPVHEEGYDVAPDKIDWYADSDKHLTIAPAIEPFEVDLGTFDSEDAVKEKIREIYPDQLKELQDTISNATVTRNDRFFVDGTIYMDERDVIGCNFFYTSGVSELKESWERCTKSSACVYKYGKNGLLSSANRKYEEDEELGLTIPGNTENGEYPTGVQCGFLKTLPNNGGNKIWYAGVEWYGSKADPIMKHILPENGGGHAHYTLNEPINVHTPIITPVTIIDPETGEQVFEKTQLVPGRTTEDIEYELLLDNDYAIKWDDDIHRQILSYLWSGDPSKYDKYVENKYMKFPFEVIYDDVCYAKNVWIKLRSPKEEYGEETGWMHPIGAERDENHWIETPFYIPSYSTEIDFGQIDFRTEAINIEGRYAPGTHTVEIAGSEYEYNITYNKDRTKYVADYNISTQLSGYLYGFAIVGIADRDQFLGIDLADESYGQVRRDEWVPLADYGWEKKVGKRSRIDTDVARRIFDGQAASQWETVNTLVVKDGKSNVWLDDNYNYWMGTLKKGTTIAYQLKTMSNMWNANDRIEITPSFSLKRVDGTVVEKENLAIWYKGKKDGQFHRMGSTDSRETVGVDSKTTGQTRLYDTAFEGSYYQSPRGSWQYGNWVAFSAAQRGISEHDYLRQRADNYTVSQITIPTVLRLFSGEWDQISWNNKQAYKDESDMEDYRDFEYFDEYETQFRKSIQTWYGEYYIPENLYVVDLTKHPGFDLVSYLTGPDGPPYIAEDDEIFETRGTLILNFDITAYKSGQPYLKYFTSDNEKTNMWKQEGFHYDDPDVPALLGEPTDLPREIPYFDGDIVEINLEQQMGDKYRPSIFNIN